MTNIDVIDLHHRVLGIEAGNRSIVVVPQEQGRPPRRIDGHTIGVSTVADEGPHGGECHPDGDELLVVVEGRVVVRLELPEGERDVEVGAGEAIVVPRGTWHRILPTDSPAEVLNVTPGPGGDWRPKR